MSAAPARPGVGHVLGAAGVVGLCISAYLVGTLNGSRAEIGDEVERSVRSGIESGVDASLTPDKIQDRSAAAGRGLVDGLIDGAIDKAGSRETHRLGRDAAGAMLREADAVAEVGLDVLEAVLAPPGEENQSGTDSAGDTKGAVDTEDAVDAEPGLRRRPSLAEEASEAAGEAVDLGFDVLDTLLAPPQSTNDPAKKE